MPDCYLPGFGRRARPQIATSNRSKQRPSMMVTNSLEQLAAKLNVHVNATLSVLQKRHGRMRRRPRQ